MLDRLRRQFGRGFPVAAVIVGALSLGACQTNGGNSPTASNAISSPANQSIAFESIDGPPEPVFDKLVANLSTEASERKMKVVSRASEGATYRVRGYLAASVTNGDGAVDWVWDVFDKDRERVLRVAGVEPVGKGADVWNKLDDATLERIAAQSLDEINTRLAAGLPQPSKRTPQATPAATTEPEVEPMEPPAVREDDGPAIAAAPASSDEGPSADALAASAAPASAALTFAAHP
jgi:hypothetical protein